MAVLVAQVIPGDRSCCLLSDRSVHRRSINCKWFRSCKSECKPINRRLGVIFIRQLHSQLRVIEFFHITATIRLTNATQDNISAKIVYALESVIYTFLYDESFDNVSQHLRLDESLRRCLFAVRRERRRYSACEWFVVTDTVRNRVNSVCKIHQRIPAGFFLMLADRSRAIVFRSAFVCIGICKIIIFIYYYFFLEETCIL